MKTKETKFANNGYEQAIADLKAFVSQCTHHLTIQGSNKEEILAYIKRSSEFQVCLRYIPDTELFNFVESVYQVAREEALQETKRDHPKRDLEQEKLVIESRVVGEYSHLVQIYESVWSQVEHLNNQYVETTTDLVKVRSLKLDLLEKEKELQGKSQQYDRYMQKAKQQLENWKAIAIVAIVATIGLSVFLFFMWTKN